MLANFFHQRKSLETYLFWVFAAVVIGFGVLAVAKDMMYIMLLPIGLIGLMFLIGDYKKIFYGFFFLLPFSVEIYLPNGLGTDLPTEPIMLVLMMLTVVLYIQNANKISSRIFFHPITLLLLLQMGWILVTAITSQDPMISIKYFIAKFWYILPFYFLPLWIVNSRSDYRKIVQYFYIGLMISIVYVLLRHSAYGFSFDKVNKAVKPIYRNHVSYAVVLVIFFPYLMFLISTAKNKLYRNVHLIAMAILLVAIYLTYTRAAHVCVFVGIGVYFIVKYKLVIYALLFASIGAVLLVTNLAYQNNYLDYAPDFQKTIEHKKFDNLLEATYKMEDISTMERVHRWVAGAHMIGQHPWVGFGPGCFYSFYKKSTVTSFETYVSDNPEKSGIHSNYLMILVEQGFFGLLIMMGIIFISLLIGERCYHQLTDRYDQLAIMSTMMTMIIILTFILINDMLETDKVGPFYLLSLSMITFFDIKEKKRNTNL